MCVLFCFFWRRRSRSRSRSRSSVRASYFDLIRTSCNSHFSPRDERACPCPSQYRSFHRSKSAQVREALLPLPRPRPRPRPPPRPGRGSGIDRYPPHARAPSLSQAEPSRGASAGIGRPSIVECSLLPPFFLSFVLPHAIPSSRQALAPPLCSPSHPDTHSPLHPIRIPFPFHKPQP